MKNNINTESILFPNNHGETNRAEFTNNNTMDQPKKNVTKFDSILY